AIEDCNIPVVEVHITDIHKREAFRQTSMSLSDDEQKTLTFLISPMHYLGQKLYHLRLPQIKLQHPPCLTQMQCMQFLSPGEQL
ncbi:MAG: type II 3-dehydroquinate dehydratase, partial [Alphaproteobacteria bacterium]|nr:type II 3-dehydroquinate dehydratase [Alphaproteobacteria bacterium]